MDRFDDLQDAAAARQADLLARHLARADRDDTSVDLDQHAAPDSAGQDAMYEGPVSPDPVSGDEADAELAELAALGEQLADLGPSLARIAEAKDRFDLAFAARLRREILATHPAAQAQTSSASAQSAEVAERSVGSRSAPDGTGAGEASQLAPAISGAPGAGPAGRWSGVARVLSPRRLLALVALVAAIALGLLVRTLASSSPQPAIVATGVRTTPERVARVPVYGPARHAAQVPSATATAHVSTHAASGIAPRPAGTVSDTVGPAASGVRATVPGGGLQQRSALSVAPPAPSALRYRLPAPLPALPTHAVSYTLRYRPLDVPAVAALVARFPALRAATGSADGTVTRTGPGSVSLRIVPATGEVSYQASVVAIPLTDFAPHAAPSRPVLTPHPSPMSTPAPHTAIAPARRAAYVRSARVWLVDHDLYPADVALTSVVASVGASRVVVRFLPALPLPLQDMRGAIDLSVDLDPGYRVLAAHALWPRLLPGTSRSLPSLAALLARPQSGGASPSVPGSGAPLAPSGPISSTARLNTAPMFAVASVRLVYVAQGLAPSATLQPAYLLEGTLTQPTGATAPYSQIVPAY